MNFFYNIATLDELKSEYRRLALLNHPDHGGSTEKMQALNAEFDLLYRTLSLVDSKHEKINTVQDSATKYRHEFYTQNGWTGSNYDASLSTKDIAQLIRDGIKIMFPLTKWSVRFKSYSGGTSISLSLMEAPYDVFVESNQHNEGPYSVNHYYIENDTHLCEQAKDMFVKVNSLVRSYRYDDSDSMIDYFDTNFYYDLSVGKWDKPFKLVAKTARIGTQANVVDKDIVSTSSTDLEMLVAEDVDTRDGTQIFVVKFSKRLNRPEFLKLMTKMESIKGYYSRFKNGFIFRYNPTEKLKEIL